MKKPKSSYLALVHINQPDDFEQNLEFCINNGLITDRICRLFAVWSYRDTLNWIKNPDPRSVEAANVAER